jgi:predicted permease
MVWVRRLWLRLQTLFRRERVAQRLDDEVQFHLEQQIVENIAAGMSPQEARYTAMRTFGNPTITKEEARDAWGWTWLENLVGDLRFAVRVLGKSPGFTMTAILTLALGIGANAAIFQLLDAVRLRSLPVSNPGELAQIEIRGGNHGFGISRSSDELTYPLWEQIRAHQEGFSGVFAWSGSDEIPLGQGSQAKRVRGLYVTGETFTTLGVRPFRGRLLTEEDDHPGCGFPGVVISYGFWQSEFGGQDDAVGSKLLIDGHPIDVLGVTPPRFFGLDVGSNFDIAVPFCSVPAFRNSPVLTRRELFWLAVMGRLKPGWSLNRASAQLEAISPGLFEATVPDGYSTKSQDTYRAFRLAAYPGGSGVSGLREKYDASLWLLLGITGLVLLIACANLANLMLARASRREREMAVRLALGAPRRRLILELLSEGLLLAVSGGVLGVLLANAFSRSILWLLSTEHSLLELNLDLDWRVLGFTASVVMATCIVFALAPALRSSRSQPSDALRSGNRGLTSGRERFSFQRALVILQMAVSLVLLAGALLFVRSFRNLATLDPGFREKDILLAFINLAPLHLPEAGQYQPVAEDLLQQIRSIPQVESAATSTHVLLEGSWTLGIHVRDLDTWSKFTWVSPGYFETMQIPLLAGRDFNTRDTPTSPHVAIVNQAFVRKYLGGANPIGMTMRTVEEPNYPSEVYEIVGVVKGTKYSTMREEIPPESFGVASQFPPGETWMSVFVRSSAPPAMVISALKEKVSHISPELQAQCSVFRKDIENGLIPERMMATLSGFFGALAALLTTIGLYGVISYIVVMRRNEIGIRMALGASRGNVVGLVLRQTLMLLTVGVTVGVVLALAATWSASSLLFGLRPNDPSTFAGASLLLIGVALTASFVPARRASRVDPMAALRYE